MQRLADAVVVGALDVEDAFANPGVVQSPIKSDPQWRKTTCPTCGGAASRFQVLQSADLAHRVAETPPEDEPLLAAASLILRGVFGIKAAILPLLFWLPRAYSAASAPVAALFAIMT